MTKKEHWQRSMSLFFREDNKRDPVKLREDLGKRAKEIGEEMSSYVEEKKRRAG